MTVPAQVHVRRAADLDAAVVLAVADGARLRLGPELLAALQVSRDLTVATLTDAGPVYGVTTGMGLQSHLAVGAAEQPAYQGLSLIHI